eukprot:GSChrysophyteH1.ASY1.ANO1.2927.1 assembled CDS
MSATRLTAQACHRLGEAAWQKMPKVNAELFSLTYGSMVAQVIRDYEEVDKINIQLEKMGYNIGVRLIDELLAKSGIGSGPPCTFRETADPNDSAFTVAFGENPLSDFVELPSHLHDLKYLNILCGVIRGGLEMVQTEVDVTFTKDLLVGAPRNEIRVAHLGAVKLQMSEDYKES